MPHSMVASQRPGLPGHHWYRSIWVCVKILDSQTGGDNWGFNESHLKKRPLTKHMHRFGPARNPRHLSYPGEIVFGWKRMMVVLVFY